jgi:hypothetical protein
MAICRFFLRVRNSVIGQKGPIDSSHRTNGVLSEPVLNAVQHLQSPNKTTKNPCRFDTGDALFSGRPSRNGADPSKQENLFLSMPAGRKKHSGTFRFCAYSVLSS